MTVMDFVALAVYLALSALSAWTVARPRRALAAFGRWFDPEQSADPFTERRVQRFRNLGLLLLLVYSSLFLLVAVGYN